MHRQMSRLNVRRFRRRSERGIICLTGFLVLATGCLEDLRRTNTGGAWYRPGVDTTWQWQLQPNADDTLNISYDVDLYDLDLFDTPASVIDQLHAQGKRVIGYFSAGSFEDFRSDASEFQAADLGNPLDGYPDERWIDVRSSNVRRIMQARLDLAAEKGFDGVEPDNMDGYTNNPGFAFSAADQLDFNRFIAEQAHSRGLAVGLKNDLDQIPQLVDLYDFAVNEQCHEFDECDALTPFIAAGKPVFNAEYLSRYRTDTVAREELCADAQSRSFQTLVLPEDLDDSFRLSCGP